MKHIYRIEVPVEVVYHHEVLIECMRKSVEQGAVHTSPEDGLTYTCVRGELDESLMKQPEGKSLICFLNDAKTEGSWAPYYPFTLSIRHEDDLFDFMRGEAAVFIQIENDAYVAKYKAHGLDAHFIAHPETIVKVTKIGVDDGAVSLVPIPSYARHFYDFQSIASAAAREAWHWDALERNAVETTRELEEGSLTLGDLDIRDMPSLSPLWTDK